jgi:hypothetical protein
VSFRLLIASLIALVPLVAGCGAESASGPEGASVAPASAALFLSVDTSFDSSQWTKARALLAKFPDGERALDSVFDELSGKGVDFERDVKPALGPETDVVGLDLSGEGTFVGLTQPKDVAKLKALLAKGDSNVVTRELDGWTVFSDATSALDEFERARKDGTLADSADYKDTMDELDADAIARAYVNGEAVQQEMQRNADVSPAMFGALLPGGRFPSLAFALEAEGGGVRLEGAGKLAGDETGAAFEPFKAHFPDEVPSGALVYLDFHGLGDQLKSFRDALAQAVPGFDRDLARIEHETRVSLDEDLFPLFANETALYVRRGLLIPEVTLVTHVEDEGAAVPVLDKLFGALHDYLPQTATPQPTTIDGVAAKVVPLAGPVSLYYAAFDGRLVLTTSREGIAALRSDDDRLSGDPDFARALDDAKVPEETTGFGYVDLKTAIPYVLDFLGMSGATVPADVRANLEPLDKLVFFGTKDGRTVRFTGFLAVD